MKKIDIDKVVEEFIGQEGVGRDHQLRGYFTHNCPLCKELRDFADYLKFKLTPTPSKSKRIKKKKWRN